MHWWCSTLIAYILNVPKKKSCGTREIAPNAQVYWKDGKVTEASNTPFTTSEQCLNGTFCLDK